MENIQKNKKSLVKCLVVACVFAISLLNLSVDFRRNSAGDIDLASLNITSQKASAEDDGSTNGYACRCHVSNYNCKDGSWISFRGKCDCNHLNENVCYNN